MRAKPTYLHRLVGQIILNMILIKEIGPMPQNYIYLIRGVPLMGFEPIQPLLAKGFSCHSMLPQPNKHILSFKAEQIFNFHLISPFKEVNASFCLLWSGLSLYHIEILARYYVIKSFALPIITFLWTLPHQLLYNIINFNLGISRSVSTRLHSSLVGSNIMIQLLYY